MMHARKRGNPGGRGGQLRGGFGTCSRTLQGQSAYRESRLQFGAYRIILRLPARIALDRAPPRKLKYISLGVYRVTHRSLRVLMRLKKDSFGKCVTALETKPSAVRQWCTCASPRTVPNCSDEEN
jgi:hypothetical protein